MEEWKRGKRELPKTNNGEMRPKEADDKRTEFIGKWKGEQERDEMGNTEYTILFGKSPSKKYPHPLRVVNSFP